MSERTPERPGKRSIGDVIGGFVAGLTSVPGDPHPGGALEAGLLRGRALLAELRAAGRPLGS